MAGMLESKTNKVTISEEDSRSFPAFKRFLYYLYTNKLDAAEEGAMDTQEQEDESDNEMVKADEKGKEKQKEPEKKERKRRKRQQRVNHQRRKLGLKRRRGTENM